MSSQERNAWIMGAVAVLGYGVYLVLVLPLMSGRSISAVPYVAPLLWTIGGAIVVSILLRITWTMFTPKDVAQDSRDRQIYQFGQSIGNAFVVAAALGALVLALVESDFFWIANAIYLGFVLSALVSSIARITSYRGEFRGW